ncbi:SMI1/KNR4 family protein [Streptomyces sp. NPDC021056]|uniref:SMI1/KNR4 family protein n=1 Tax=Streptomyces sp. NPDC021056 TaxID=3155012 RepID=UPI0034066125
MSVEESWGKIERWIAQHAPEEDPLPAPCTRADLDALYESLGGRLPEDVERSLLRHNGSGLTVIIPPGFTLLSVEDILENRADWLKYAAPDDKNLTAGDKPFLVPIATLSVIQLLVDIRTGRLGEWDIQQGFVRERDPLWRSFSSALDIVGNVLASPPPWIAILPGDDEWEVTNRDPDFPGMLVWTEDPVD